MDVVWEVRVIIRGQAFYLGNFWVFLRLFFSVFDTATLE